MPPFRGSVVWFDEAKGYGFIKPSDGTRDVFVHYTGIDLGDSRLRGERRRNLQPEACVEYEVRDVPKGPLAYNVRVVQP